MASAMNALDRITHELQVMRPGVTLGPLALASPLAALALAARDQPGVRAIVIFAAWLILQILLPNFSGMLAAGLVTGEAASDILLALPTPYRQIAATRLLLALAITTLVALGVSSALVATGFSPAQTPLQPGVGTIGAEVIACLAPLIACAGVGWGLAIFSRSARATPPPRARALPRLVAATAVCGTPARWALVQGAFVVAGGLAAIIGWLCLHAPESVARQAQVEE